jgi:hypothetical protein
MNSFLENRPMAARKDGSKVIAKTDSGFRSFISQDGAAAPSPATNFAPKPPPAAETEPTPQIELIENGGRVERIIVTCTCCNRIELQCQY